MSLLRLDFGQDPAAVLHEKPATRRGTVAELRGSDGYRTVRALQYDETQHKVRVFVSFVEPRTGIVREVREVDLADARKLDL